MKEKLVNILNKTNIPELQNVEEVCALPGAYVNMESTLPDGTVGKILDDKKTYTCCQIPINEEECYGVAADEERVIIYRYKNDDSASTVIQIIEL